MKKLLLLVALLIPQLVFSQAGPIRGEVAPGQYENILTDGAQHIAVNVSISGNVWTTTNPTVTSSSGVLLAANAARKVFIIQNNDVSGIVYLGFGVTATTSMLQVGPGQSLTISVGVPVVAINAIGSIASNTNLVVISGQ